MRAPRVTPLESIAFAAVAVGYCWMSAPGVCWMDSGELTAAAYTLGGAHPPGHPAHTLLGKLATMVPLGDVAFRLNLLSSLASAAAIAGVVALGRALVADATLPAVVAAALAAASPVVTTNATRAEVYGPVAAMIVWATVAVVRLLREPGRGSHGLLGTAFACALAAAVHPLIATAAAAPMAIAAGRATRSRLRHLAAPAVALGLLGLFTYAYLPMRASARDTPLLMWGEPSSLSQLWTVLTAPAYRGNFAVGGAAERFASLWLLVGEGTGLPLVLLGITGLSFAALTGLRGAGLILAIAVAVVAGAATQAETNPDMPGYVEVALLMSAAGLVPLVSAIERALGPLLAAVTRSVAATATATAAPAPTGDDNDSSATAHGERGWRLAAQAVVLAPALGLATVAPIARADDGGSRRRNGDAPLLHWQHTVGALPAGPAIYFANADHSLFPAQYQRLVAGARPDVVVANADLVRDIWFLRYLDRQLPDLYWPYVDDDATDAIAARAIAGNLRAGRYVGGDVPAFGQLRSSHAGVLDRAYTYQLTPVAGAPPARPPPDYPGGVGRRVAGLVGLVRAGYEGDRGRLRDVAIAAGVADQFAPAALDTLEGLGTAAEPLLFSRLPSLTPVFLFAPWQRQLIADDLAWRLGRAPAPVSANDPAERHLLRLWHELLRHPDTSVIARARQLPPRLQAATRAALAPLLPADIAAALR